MYISFILHVYIIRVVPPAFSNKESLLSKLPSSYYVLLAYAALYLVASPRNACQLTAVYARKTLTLFPIPKTLDEEPRA